MKTDLPYLRVLIMMSRTFFYGIILTYLFSGVLLANEGNAQHKSVNEVFISLKLQQVTVRRALESIQENTEFKFIFEQGVLSATEGQRVTLMVDNESVADVLKTVSNETDLSFRQLNGSIVVKAPPPLKKLQTPKEEESALEQNISGKVTDENGEPLPGASVLVKNTSIGVITDAVGNYRLSAPDKATTLVFSYVGYERKEVAIAGRAVIDISLKFDVTTLGEVVVNVGYYEVNKKVQTGNIAKVTAQEIEKQPITNPLQALQGRVAGVYIQQNTGVPGGGFDIQIRGQNSLRNTLNDNGNQPFYIVDGVPYVPSSLSSFFVGGQVIPNANPLNSINPADIESIEILKDADATAIYGSRGANGVVLITTKKGTPGKTKVNFDISTGVGKVGNKMELLNTEQYLEMRREAWYNAGLNPEDFAFAAFDLLEWDTTRYTDWQDVLLGGTANVTNAQATISGGNSKTQFLFSGGYFRETTVFPSDFAYQRGSGHFNLNHTSDNSKLRVSLVISNTRDNNNLIRSDLTRRALNLPPNAPDIFEGEGNLNWENGTWENPFAILERKYEAKTKNLITNTNISYEVLPGLQLKSNLGYSNLQLDEFSTIPAGSQQPGSGLPAVASSAKRNEETWIVEPQLDYNTNFGGHRLNILIGSTFQRNLSESERIQVTGFASDALIRNIQAGTTILSNISDFTEYHYNALFGRINYIWEEKYIFNLTGRRDGSSRFGPGNQFANFGAIGTAWIFSEEDFIKNSLPFLSFGKLRASYGTTGSDAIGDYGYLDSYSSTQRPYQNIGGLIPIRLANPDYGWEKVKKLEFGLETGFIGNRILLTASHYRNRSSNQLVGLPLSNITGFSSIQANLPATVENTGWEFELNTTNMRNSNFNWVTSFNVTIPRNKLLEYPDLGLSPFANTYEVGKSLFIRKVFNNTGVDPETGMYTFEDISGDESITFPEDILPLKEVAQQYFGGVRNSITYKGLQVDFLFQFVKQTGNNIFRDFGIPGVVSAQQPISVLDRWQKPGDISNFQQFTVGLNPDIVTGHNNNFLLGTNSVTDASFVRLKNVSISYQISDSILEQWRLENLRIYIQGQNLITLTDYQGLDPESQGSSLPPLRMITGGLQITF